MATRLSNDVTKPQPTEPGDAPADTTDRRERATSVAPDKRAAAAAGHRTVNAVVKAGDLPALPPPPGGGRVETYKQRRADGTEVTVTHNYDTGTTAVAAPPTPEETTPAEAAPTGPAAEESAAGQEAGRGARTRG
ncbi:MULTISPECIES: hypothetical protein [unclassified Crossiella]|uniref:hypothetical protein n=1 Tax=unclassified Crossiella TaxID=2620835 RepID=UPI001FFE95DE|nr:MULTISPECIES: hypothetical protein [unclassified Crossiella]MCK2242325.1 hypothetical protein [Crossiella sp. S99.2]MCK2254644.1 hypothetical protein [Crossiella sp. S99.1]